MRPTRMDNSDALHSPSGQHRISGTLYPEDWQEEVETAHWRRDAERPTSRQWRTSRRPPGTSSRTGRTGKHPTRLGRFARGVTGSLAVGFAILAIALIVVQFWSTNNGQEGPGTARLITHIVVAVVALLSQAVADRRRDSIGGFATLGVFASVIGVIWFWWWL